MRTTTHYLKVIHNHQHNNLGTERNLDIYASRSGVTHYLVLPIEPFVKTDDIFEVTKGSTGLCEKFFFKNAHALEGELN
jgi:hypothetical protein